MAKIRRASKIDTKEARTRLEARQEPYWRQIHSGLSLGYYKGVRGGTWYVRELIEGKYRKRRLGVADDHADADGKSVLSFAQAQRIAMEGIGQDRTAGYTVADALDDYLENFEKRARSYKETRQTVENNIKPHLGSKKVESLTPGHIRSWVNQLLEPNDENDTARKKADPTEWLRRRKATANRVLTVLKAALNEAYQDGKVPSDSAWRRVKPFPNVDKPKVQYLTHDESVRLVNACDPEFRPLVRAALLTACRYGELRNMKVSDYNPDSGTVQVTEAKSGKARHVPLTDEGVRMFDDLTAGRKAKELMFTRADGSQWGKSHQQRPMIQACERAGIDPPISFHVLRHTYGSLLAMRGTSLQVIARAMGHADTRMTERHYAHLQPDHVSKAIRGALPDFGAAESNVERIDQSRGRTQ